MLKPDGDQKNVLLVVIDCLRADHVYEDMAHIPFIGKCRSNGFSFLNTIASTTTTTPSFASLLTGLYPFENGVRSHSGYALRKDVTTFPEVLKGKGYHTYAEVSGPLGEETGLSRGFDEWNLREAEETIFTSWGDRLRARFSNHYKGPWFVMLHIWALHDPRWVLPELDRSEYGRSRYARALSSIDKYLGRLSGALPAGTLIVLTGDHGEEIVWSRFDALKKSLGIRTLNLKHKMGRTHKHISQEMRGRKVGHGYSIYDELLKIPLLFYDGETIPFGSSTTQVRQIDIFPTILDLVGIEHELKTTGESLARAIRGEGLGHKEAYVEAVGQLLPTREKWIAGIRVDNRYKYIHSPYVEDFQEELYDLEVDPDERRNLAKTRPELVSQLRDKIKALRTEELVGERIAEEDEKVVMERLRALGYVD